MYPNEHPIYATTFGSPYRGENPLKSSQNIPHNLQYQPHQGLNDIDRRVQEALRNS